MPKSQILKHATNNIEYGLYAYIAWRLSSYFIPSDSLLISILTSTVAIFCISIATFAGSIIFKKLKNTFSDSPPFASTAIILILTITIILNLKDSSLFAFSFLLAIYCRLVKGIAANNYKSNISNFSLLNFLSIIAGFVIASRCPALQHTDQLAMNIWRFPFICATTLSLLDILKYNIAFPTLRKAKHLYHVKKQAKNNNITADNNPASWVEAILLCSFLIIELEVGGYYWLKTIVAIDNAPGILAFIVSSTIFILSFGMFSGSKVPTKSLLGWGFIGPTITTPLHFMIGDNSNFILALSGQAFFMIFVAAAAAGIMQRLRELFPNKTMLSSITRCWLLSFGSIAIITHYVQQNIILNPMWIAAFVGSILWVFTQGKSLIKN